MSRFLSLILAGSMLAIGPVPTQLGAADSQTIFVSDSQNLHTTFAQPVTVVGNTIVQPVLIPAYSYGYEEPTGFSGIEKPMASYAATPPRAPSTSKKIIVTVDEDYDEADWPRAPEPKPAARLWPSKGPATSTSDDGRAIAILKKNCAECHTGLSARKGVHIFDEPSRLNPNISRWTLWDIADRGIMPPKTHTPLSESDLEILRKWARRTSN